MKLLLFAGCFVLFFGYPLGACLGLEHQQRLKACERARKLQAANAALLDELAVRDRLYGIRSTSSAANWTACWNY